jgi:hypothetical protein
MILIRRVLTAVIVLGMMTTLGMGLVSVPTSATTTSLTVEGRSGSVTLYLADLQAMTPVQGQSSFQNSLGNWRGAGYYIGVSVSDLVALVGGMVPGDTVTVYASDDYNMTYSYYNVYNAWPDPSIQGSMIVAYSYNGNVTPTWPDGLRVAFLPPDEAYSNADFLATATPDQNSGSAGARWISSVARVVVNVAPWTVTLKKDPALMTYGGQQIANMTSVTAWGGYQKSSGTIVGPDLYTGVNVSYLLQWVGGMSPTDSLQVTSTDAYQQTFSYSLAMGNETVWTILAYAKNGTPLADAPKIAFVGPDYPITTASLWQKYVSIMEIIANRAPVVTPLANVTGDAGQSLAFSASATDSDGDTLQYTWDFGDGTGLEVGEVMTHTYVNPGAYAVTVYVDDMTGLEGHNVSSSATVSVAFALDLVAGWNFVTIPVFRTPAYMASTLGLLPGDTISGYDPATKKYKTYVVGGPPPADFAIAPSTGYWIHTNSAETLHLGGSCPTTTQTRTITVPAGGGWAVIGFNSLNTTMKASSVPGMCTGGSITIIASYNPVTETYKTYIPGGPPPTDFALAPGQAYWVYCTASLVLTYDP